MNKDNKIYIASAHGILNLDDIYNPDLTDAIGEFFVEEVCNFKDDIVGFKELITGKRIIDRPRDTAFFELLLKIDLDSSLPYKGIIFRQHRLPKVGDVWWKVSNPIKKSELVDQKIFDYLNQSPEKILIKLEQVYKIASEVMDKSEYLRKSDITKKLIKSKKY